MNSFEKLGLAAAFSGFMACNGSDSSVKDSEVDDDTAGDTATLPGDTDTDSGTGTDTDTDTGTGTDTDTGTDSGTDSGADTGTDTGIAEVTTFTQATCERLQRELPSALDDLSLTQFVASRGEDCTRDGRTFGDSNFEATLKNEVVGACVWNGEGTSADETRVIRVPATDTDPDTLAVEADIDSSGEALSLAFYDASEQLLAPDAEASNPIWIYGDEAGDCTDTSFAE